MLSIAALVIVCVANGLLGAVILLNNSRAAINRIFSTLTFAVAAWSIVAYLEDVTAARSLLSGLGKLDYALAATMISLFYAFCRLLTDVRNRWVDGVMLGLAPSVIVMSLLGAVVKPQLQNDGNVALVPQYGYPIFACLMILGLGASLAYLIFRFRHSQSQAKSQQAIVALGVTLSVFVLVIADIILPITFNVSNTEVARVGIYGLLFFTGLSTYAIIRHQLFDVRRLVARSITYLLLIATLGASYVAVAFAISHAFFSTNTSSLNQTITYAALSLVLAFTFHPLQRRFEHFTDRIFYHDHYDAGKLLEGISRILVSEIDIDRTLAQSLDVLCSGMHIQFGQLVIFNDDRVYRVGHFGPLPRRLLVAPELRRLGTGMVVADELTTGERHKLLTEHGIRVSLGLKTRGEFTGYLLLGDKLSGDSYTKDELELLATVGKELAVGVSNAKAYAEIQAFNLTLQDRVNHATARLRVANRHLKELDKTKDEFISMASHQLRTPLTTIKGYLSMMSEGDAGKLTATQRDFVAYAFDASERMVNLISDLLNVSRLEAGRFMIQTKPVDISAMVADEVRQLQPHAANKAIKLTYIAPAEEIPLVELDENKTRQVMMNFIDNALYYTKVGEVRVYLKRIDDIVRVEVIDTGIGVPDAAKKKLFSKFFRADNAQGVRPDGTGLGLYLARRVIADQDGTIIFKSTEGQGSTFGFELPIKHVTRKVQQ